MPNWNMLYSIIYALAARDGRESALFGDCAPLANRAFDRSLAGNAFPELWFELPLAGDPWFDLHVLTDRDTLDGCALFPGETPFHAKLFEWFARQSRDVRQFALSYDLKSGDADQPAAQLLVRTEDPETTCSFLKAAERPDAADAYRAFRSRIPQGWFACYTGMFPHRPDVDLHVECIPQPDLQHAYARDAHLIETHLRQAGLAELGTALVPRCHELAKTPFKIEFQFEVSADGTTGPTFGASLRFACPPGEGDWEPFRAQGDGGALMQMVESWGLADDRWRLFEDATFAKRGAGGGQAMKIFNFPAFLKLRWRDGEPLDAKAYFMAGAQDSDGKPVRSQE